jgi:hypothetical protein
MTDGRTTVLTGDGVLRCPLCGREFPVSARWGTWTRAYEGRTTALDTVSPDGTRHFCAGGPS